MKITKIDRPTCKLIRDALECVLASMEKEMGLRAKVGNARFMPTTVTFKIELSTTSEEGIIQDAAAADFRQWSTLWGMEPTDLGRTFRSLIGDRSYEYKIVGAKPRSHKYPILAKQMPDGKTFKFSTSRVKELLGRSA